MNDDSFQHFDLFALLREFPDTAETMLLDRYLRKTPEASTRLFRVYRPTPAHYHQHCDEHLLVLSGRGTFWAGDSSHSLEFAPGTLLVFPRLMVHAMPTMLEGPIVFLALDAPPREPADVHFVNPEDGTAQTFIRSSDGGSQAVD